MRAGPPRPAGERDAGVEGTLARVTHDLRASLNGIRAWNHVLRERLAGCGDPLVARAIDGIAAGVESQVRTIENLFAADAVQSPLRRTAMGKRKDAQPDIPEDSTAKDRPKRPGPPLAKEQPGDAAKAEGDARNKTTREGKR